MGETNELVAGGRKIPHTKKLERIPRESYCKGKDFKGHFLHMRGNAHGVSSGFDTIVRP